MAMTKKERELFDSLKLELARAKAFRLHDPVLPDVKIPQGIEPLAKGWLPVGKTVNRACTDSINHCAWNDEKTTTQRPRPLYSTKLLALKALRYQMSNEFSYELAYVQRMIDEEESRGSVPDKNA